MQVYLSSGDYDIINSGYVFLFGKDEDLKIDIDAENGFKFALILKFRKDDSVEKKIEKEMIDQTIILSCINFRNNGTGLASPVNIATVNGKELYFMFWAYQEGEDEVRGIKYTLFYEK